MVFNRLDIFEICYDSFIISLNYISKYYFLKGLTRSNRRDCAQIELVNPNARKEGLDKKFRALFGDITEIIDNHIFKTVETEGLPKDLKKALKDIKQIKERRYKYGEKKMQIKEMTFEKWIEELE